MTSLVKPCVAAPSAAWIAAAKLVARWFGERERIDRLWEALPPALTGVERARCQHLVFGVVRHAGRLEAALNRLIAHPPRFVTRAAIFVAGFELLEADEGLAAKIVHHAVNQTRALASPAEARLANAVLRRLAESLRAQGPPPRLAPAEALAEYYSHPLWLVRRWLVQLGAEATRALLEWNQSPAPVYARWRGRGSDRDGTPAPLPPSWLKPTSWPGFFEVPPGHWAEIEPLLKIGQIYLQDPSARRAVELLAPRPGETVLDLCAAPGGKSLLIADAMGAGRLAAVDLPGPRIDRLRENLSKITGVEALLVPGDILRGADKLLRENQLPAEYSAVLADVPCSNTGVMRHRVDVKWRLQEGDFGQHARQQLTLLAAAARLVAPGGRLVYSTCSIDPEENERVVAAFLREASGRFQLEAQEISRPWTAGHDGAGVFLFRARDRLP